MDRKIIPIAHLPFDTFGFFAWPSITRLQDGKYMVVASGFRCDHVCPYGKLVYFLSSNGKDWSMPYVLIDRHVDERDVGITTFGKHGIIVSWFAKNSRRKLKETEKWNKAYRQQYGRLFEKQTRDFEDDLDGEWTMTSFDRGETWEPPVRVIAASPHGPVALKSGRLFYVGKFIDGPIIATVSDDRGTTWEKRGDIPYADGHIEENYQEPHAIELNDGRVLCHIRYQVVPKTRPEMSKEKFAILQTISADRGRTWSEPVEVVSHGSPPHLMRHSSGKLICTYGFRWLPYGIKATTSDDEGATWIGEYAISEGAADSDLGYPASVEMEDGSILTVWYQKILHPNEKCGIFSTIWEL